MASYIEAVVAYLVSVSAFTRDAAVPLKILGEAVPKPPCLLKIRPVLQDCPLFNVQQDPKHLPVQWVWLAVPSSPPTSTAPQATAPVATASVTRPYPTTPKATGGAGGGMPSSFKPRPSLSKSGSSPSYPYPCLPPPPSTPSLSTSGSSPMPAMLERERYALTGVLSVRDMFHANPKERAYLAGIQRLRTDLEKLKEAGVLQVSLSKTVEADILEFLGDVRFCVFNVCVHHITSPSWVCGVGTPTPSIHVCRVGGQERLTNPIHSNLMSGMSSPSPAPWSLSSCPCPYRPCCVAP